MAAKWNIRATEEAGVIREKYLDAIYQSYDPRLQLRDLKKVADRQAFMDEKVAFENAHVNHYY